jgi:hypothetical protein
LLKLRLWATNGPNNVMLLVMVAVPELWEASTWEDGASAAVGAWLLLVGALLVVVQGEPCG